MALIEQLPEEVRSDDKYRDLKKLQKSLFLVSHMQGICLDKMF